MISHRYQLKCDGRAGAALLTALVLVTVVATLTAGLVQLNSSYARKQTAALADQRAFYLAEAGLAESFQAVRIGRTGQVGSESTPARVGEGLVWVDVLELADGNLRLDSTALIGTGRASLSLVIEPIEEALGFFADENLTLDSVILVDGYDSEVSTYAEQLQQNGNLIFDPNDRTLFDDRNNQIFHYQGNLYRYDSIGEGELKYNHAVSMDSIYEESLKTGYEFQLDWDESPLASTSLAEFDFDSGFYPELQLEPVLDYFNSIPEPHPALAKSSSQTTAEHGLLGSNGDITLLSPQGENIEIWGDITPGPSGSVSGLESSIVTGVTEPRPVAVELPTVEIPSIKMASPITHTDLLPKLLSGTSAYESIKVAKGAEIVVQGPATVVIGTLLLEPGALMRLDTRLGEVAIYVRDELDLMPGSLVETSGENPKETIIQVGETSDGDDPAAKLDAHGQFHGTVFAPDSNVRIGTNFEIFGGVVARRLSIEQGARLHFDHAGLDGTALPRIIGWRVIEIPAVAKPRFSDLSRLFDVNPRLLQPLANAHDLQAVTLTVKYLDALGNTQTFSGTEDLFDWTEPSVVLAIDRNPKRLQEEPEQGTSDEDSAPSDPEDELDPFFSMALNSILNGIEKQTPQEVMQGLDQLGSSPLLNQSEDGISFVDKVLLFLVGKQNELDAPFLKDILVLASPLSKQVVDTVTTNPIGKLTQAQVDEVLKANP